MKRGADATRADVARIFGRAAFGARAEDLDSWVGKPYSDMVEHLLDIPAIRPPEPDDPRRLYLTAGSTRNNVIGLHEREAVRWWLERMRTTPYPLEERMVFLWHDHFATAWKGDYPDIGLLVLQNQTLRRNALGNFRTLCQEITIDPAMLWWLNGTLSVKGALNENYAREFFELFTLGTTPQIYTERDIRESARALTGWFSDPFLQTATFSPEAHDDGTKRVLGKRIANAGDKEYLRVVDIALEQPLAYRFVASKLVLGLAYVPKSTNLMRTPDPLVAEVARALQRSDWDLAEGVRTLLLSDGFRYGRALRSRQVVRQPVELVVALCKALDVSADTEIAVDVLERMGQVPFRPPNVGGWPVGREWLSPTTAIARYDWAIAVDSIVASTPSVLDPLPVPEALDAWAARFGLASLSANTRDTIDGYVRARRSAPVEERRAGVIALLASSPDWTVI